jgi:hypothetical protein
MIHNLECRADLIDPEDQDDPIALEDPTDRTAQVDPIAKTTAKFMSVNSCGIHHWI